MPFVLHLITCKGLFQQLPVDWIRPIRTSVIRGWVHFIHISNTIVQLFHLWLVSILFFTLLVRILCLFENNFRYILRYRGSGLRCLQHEPLGFHWLSLLHNPRLGVYNSNSLALTILWIKTTTFILILHSKIKLASLQSIQVWSWRKPMSWLSGESEKIKRSITWCLGNANAICPAFDNL